MARPRMNDRTLIARKRQVRERLHQGMSNAMIATALSITEKTVESHIRNIYE